MPPSWCPTEADLRRAADAGTRDPGWPALRAHAAAHHGVLGRAEATTAGVGKDALRRAVASGRLVQVHRGVFAVVAPERVEGVWRAGCLAVGGALTGSSGLRAWSVLPVTDEGVLALAVPARRRPVAGRPPSAVVTGVVPTTRRGVPVLPFGRCVLDAAPELAAGLLEQALNEGLVRGLVTEAALPALPALVAGHHGAKPLRAVVEEMLRGTARRPTRTGTRARRSRRRRPDGRWSR